MKNVSHLGPGCGVISKKCVHSLKIYIFQLFVLILNQIHDVVCYLGGRVLSAKVCCQDLARSERVVHSFVNFIGSGHVAQVAQHQCRRPYGSDWIGDAFASDIRSRAMDPV